MMTGNMKTYWYNWRWVMPSPIVFVIRSSILVIGLWMSYRSFKVLLPSVWTSPVPLNRRHIIPSIYSQRLPQYCYSVHSTYMASRPLGGFDEWLFWGSVEMGAHWSYGLLWIIAESCSFHGFTKAFFRKWGRRGWGQWTNYLWCHLSNS